MTLARHDSFRPVGQILAAEVLPRLHLAQKLPLRISCIGTASFDVDARGFDHSTPLGEGQSPEEAMSLATLRVSRCDIRAGSGDTLRFRPRLVVIQDRELGLVLAGEIRGGVILWQQPVASDAEARRVVLEASRLRGMAFNMPDQGPARELRHRASLCEVRLVDTFWREVAAELLALPQAA
ncbi:hypothetical protein [Szabonella alba]|uniref:Uncharacterized protein n=1 Tax=Szabonella alba TaxID=2804194 RepID=A0A8K0Y2Q0_9RHOB|nr:hypothetical protein [Szabonella alba]MBL4918649.1 hypothetical protein [Szabonella alba]